MQTEVEAALNEAIANGPALWSIQKKELQTFMFLHVIVDASMPAMIVPQDRCTIKTANNTIL
jgi:monomeric isocitrate dehydrogenase